MTDTKAQTTPVVPAGATQGGEILKDTNNNWMEACVWTERMVSALVNGVKGGRWYSLMDKVFAPATLEAAWEKVWANDGAAGVDRQSIERFEAQEELYLKELSTALRMVMEPIFERDFATHSYGFRPNRGCKDALRRVQELLNTGYVHIVDADLKSYFDTIPKDRLKALIGRKVTDGRILALITSFLEQGVLDGEEEWTPEQGTPQGAVVSPLLSNIYLDPLDHLMAVRGFEMVRYADDFVVMCRSEEDAAAALAVVQQWTAQAGLTLHPTKTRLVDEREHGFDFLGYHFEAGKRWPRAKSRTKLRDTIRAKTKRTSGHSMTQIIADVNRTLRGWFEYFKHSRAPTFRMEDGFVRRRLRSILRKRSHRKGSAKANGADQSRWTIAYFAELGLFSLQHAHAAAGQSSCR